MPPDVPAWFTHALAQEGERGEVDVDGVTVRYLAWGDPTCPPLVLVHGGAAHARWWAATAPFLAEDHRVAAIDLSGHGDSDHRERYAATTWAEEVLAVGEAVGGTGRPTVVGHSMGGFVTVVAAALHGPRLAGAMVLDAPIRAPDPESEEGGRHGRNMFRRPKVYPDRETAVAHFHLVPPQPVVNPWLVDAVAGHSVREVDGGVTWKFDRRVFSARSGPDRPSDFGPALAEASCRLAVLTGARSSIVDDGVIEHMQRLVVGSPAAAAGVPFVKVPEAHHHVLLDQPLALVAAIRAVLAGWSPVGVPPPSLDGVAPRSDGRGR